MLVAIVDGGGGGGVIVAIVDSRVITTMRSGASWSGNQDEQSLLGGAIARGSFADRECTRIRNGLEIYFFF